MATPRRKNAPEAQLLRRALPAAWVGEVVEVDAHGRLWVRFAGSGEAPVRARVAASLLREIGAGVPVLLLFEGGDPARPIAIDRVRDLVEREAVVDGERIALEARQEVVLRCGKASIVLRRDGKVLIRGAYVVSRSSGPNKLKGASIDLN